jgi:hypothetical protein
MFEFYSNDDDPEILQANMIALYCRWLYQAALADGKPRVLQFERRDILDYSPIYLFIDRIKQVIIKATCSRNCT